MRERPAAKWNTIPTTRKVNVDIYEGGARSGDLQQQKDLDCSLETSLLKQ